MRFEGRKIGNGVYLPISAQRIRTVATSSGALKHFSLSFESMNDVSNKVVVQVSEMSARDRCFISFGA